MQVCCEDLNIFIYFFQANHLTGLEVKANSLKHALASIDPMDYKTVNSLNDESIAIKKALKVG